MRAITVFLVPLCFWLIDLCSASRMEGQASVLIFLQGALAHAAVPGGGLVHGAVSGWDSTIQKHDLRIILLYSSGIHPGTFHSAFCSLPRNWDLQPTSELRTSFVSWKQA